MDSGHAVAVPTGRSPRHVASTTQPPSEPPPCRSALRVCRTVGSAVHRLRCPPPVDGAGPTNRWVSSIYGVSISDVRPTDRPRSAGWLDALGHRLLCASRPPTWDRLLRGCHCIRCGDGKHLLEREAVQPVLRDATSSKRRSRSHRCSRASVHAGLRIWTRHQLLLGANCRSPSEPVQPHYEPHPIQRRNRRCLPVHLDWLRRTRSGNTGCGERAGDRAIDLDPYNSKGDSDTDANRDRNSHADKNAAARAHRSIDPNVFPNGHTCADPHVYPDATNGSNNHTDVGPAVRRRGRRRRSGRIGQLPERLQSRTKRHQ